jgi:hypothetical protein
MVGLFAGIPVSDYQRALDLELGPHVFGHAFTAPQ